MEKQQKKNTTTTKKATVTKKSTTVKKSTTSKKKTSNKNVKNKESISKKTSFFKSTKFLTIVFVVLLILVLILGFFAIRAKKKYDSTIKANIVIPIIKKDDTIEFSINAYELSQAPGYVFKVKNYRGDKINKEQVEYDIEIVNGTNSRIELTKGKNNKNLLTGENNSQVNNETLKQDEKELVYYTLKIPSKNNSTPKKNEIISVRIVVKK